MKITRSATAKVIPTPQGARVDFWLNEAVAESAEDEKLLARVRTAAANAYLGLVASNDAPFERCLVCVRHRQNETDSVVMFSPQAAAILFAGNFDEVLARRQRRGYGRTRGAIDGRPFLGFASRDEERVLIVEAPTKAVIDAFASFFVPESSRDDDPDSQIDAGIPSGAEVLAVKVKTIEQALEAFEKYGIAYLEPKPPSFGRRRKM